MVRSVRSMSTRGVVPSSDTTGFAIVGRTAVHVHTGRPRHRENWLARAVAYAALHDCTAIVLAQHTPTGPVALVYSAAGAYLGIAGM